MRCDRLGEFGGFGNRKPDTQHGAGSVTAVLRLNRAALRLNKAAADRQPQAGAGAPPVLRLHPVEFIEHPLQIAGRDPRALVADLDYDSPVLIPRMDTDSTVRRRIVGAVAQE